jgi:N-acyl-D-amino-acid deacylase
MEFDVLIRNGSVVDGSGAPARPADVGIRGDRIAAIDSLDGATAATTIDATGKVVSPGFIDVHVHSEVANLGAEHRYGSVLQGVTTNFIGADGFGWAPLPEEKARRLWESTLTTLSEDDAGLSLDWPTVEDFLAIFPGNTPVNIVSQVPHTAVRMGAMGMEARLATDDELEQMKATTREWMEAGAVGICLGLDYEPSSAADTRELVELSKVVREYGGVYAAHIRYIDIGAEAAWRETMEIGEQADIPVHISHEEVDDLKARLLDEAAQRCDLTFESYMYPAGCTRLTYLLPTWANEGGPRGLRDRLRDPRIRQQLRDHVQHNPLADEASGVRPVFVHTQTGRYIGMTIAEAARTEQEEIGDFVVRVLDEEFPTQMLIYHRAVTPEAHSEIIRNTIQHPAMMVASDGVYHGISAHPRGYACFARVLRLCVREMQAVTLEQAVHKMSGFSADRFGLTDRGHLREGYAADVVIFDPNSVADRATWEEPRLEPVGIDRVIVNGKTVVMDGEPTGKLPGQVVRMGA